MEAGAFESPHKITISATGVPASQRTAILDAVTLTVNANVRVAAISATTGQPGGSRSSGPGLPASPGDITIAAANFNASTNEASFLVVQGEDGSKDDNWRDERIRFTLTAGAGISISPNVYTLTVDDVGHCTCREIQRAPALRLTEGSERSVALDITEGSQGRRHPGGRGGFYRHGDHQREQQQHGYARHVPGAWRGRLQLDGRAPRSGRRRLGGRRYPHGSPDWGPFAAPVGCRPRGRSATWRGRTPPRAWRTSPSWPAATWPASRIQW